MAVVFIFRELVLDRMSPGFVALSTPTHRMIVAGPLVIEVDGVGLTGSVPGVVTGYQVSDEQGPLCAVAGIAIESFLFFRTLTSNVPAHMVSLLFGGADAMFGSSADEVLDGHYGADLLDGAGGDDRLYGGFGSESDTLHGGPGNDVFLLGDPLFGPSGDDVVIEAPGEGWDVVQSWSSHVLTPNVEELRLAGEAWFGTGNELDNLLTGTDGPNSLYGAGGVDTLRGGLGNDRYLMDDVWDVLEDAGGRDAVLTPLDGYVLPDGVEELELQGMAKAGIGNALANRITGNGEANALAGHAGDDTLDGGAGGDTLEGGAGNDTYVVDSAGDLVVEQSGGGIDWIESTVSLHLWEGVENLRLSGWAHFEATGNDLDNLLVTADSNDTLDGGAGADTMAGDYGDDLYLVDNVGDVIEENPAHGGADRVLASISLHLGTMMGIEYLQLAGHLDLDAVGNVGTRWVIGNAGHNVLSGQWSLEGGAGADNLSGSSEDNLLDGGEGVDTMAGGQGSDTYFVDDAADVVIELQAASGIDEIYSTVSLTLAAHVERLWLSGEAAINGTGTPAGNERLTGNDGANLLDGAGGQGDVLSGGAGNDTLVGGSGESRLGGGAGDDVYLLGDPLNLIDEWWGYGIDTVVAGFDHMLGYNLEHLTLSAGRLGTGNDLANRIVGNAGDNVLDGRTGADTLEGGAGNDSYVVDHVGDVVIELQGQGLDQVTAHGVGFSLAGTGLELLRLVGPAGERLDAQGNDADNILEGSFGNNSMHGGAGADRLDGGGGNDTLEGGAGNDTLDGGGGVDEVRYAGNRSAYALALGAGTVTVNGAHGTDVLTGIDRIVFSDSTAVLNAHEAGGSVGIEGIVMVNRVLTAVNRLSDGDGMGAGAVGWQWFRGEAAIEGATGSSLDLSAADLGATVRVRARFLDGAGNSEMVWSQPTMPVAAEDLVHPSAELISASMGPATGDVMYWVTFSEPVQGLMADDFLVGNGSVASLVPDQIHPLAWRITVTPTPGFSGLMTLDLRPGAVADAGGNINALQSAQPQIVDLIGPVFVRVNLDRLLLGMDQPIAVEFSQPLTAASGAIGLMVARDPPPPVQVDPLALQVIDGVLLFHPPFLLAASTSYRMLLPAGAVQAGAGHALAQDTVVLFDVPAARYGGPSAQKMNGAAFAEAFWAGAGNDTVAAGGGDDLQNGGAGIDTSVFTGARRDYSIEANALGHVVRDRTAGRDGRDALAEVERLQFSDYSVDVTLPVRAQQVSPGALKTLEELYVGFFNRIPEAQGLGYWIDELAAGLPLATIADQFHEAGLVFGVYPEGLDNAAFIRIVYAHVLGRPQDSPNAPDADEIAHWDAWLKEAGHSRGGMVLQMLGDVHTWFAGHADFGFVARHLDNKAAVAHYYAVEQGLGLLDAQANIAFGTQLAALVTPDDVSAAIALVGLQDAPG